MKKRGCLKINLRWPLLFHSGFKSFVFSQKSSLQALLLKMQTIMQKHFGNSMKMVKMVTSNKMAGMMQKMKWK